MSEQPPSKRSGERTAPQASTSPKRSPKRSSTSTPKSTTKRSTAKRSSTRKSPPRKGRATPGRPSDLTRVVRTITTDDGPREITVHDVIVEEVARGSYVEMACGMAGVAKRTVYTWLTHGARIAKARHDPRPSIDLAALTEHDVACERFLHAVDAAEATAFAQNLRAIERLCVGGVQTTKTKRIMRNGRVIGEEVTTETTLPDAATIRWRSERRWPNLLGRMERVEISGVGGGPIEVEERSRTEALLGDLERIAERHVESTRLYEEAQAEIAALKAGHVIDVESTESTNGSE